MTIVTKDVEERRMDFLRRWISERVDIIPHQPEPTANLTELHDDYRSWCWVRNDMISGDTIPVNVFQRWLSDAGISLRKHGYYKVTWTARLRD